MTCAEEKNRGTLTVDIEYEKFAIRLNVLIYACQRFKDDLEIAAIKRNIPVEHNRRKGDGGYES